MCVGAHSALSRPRCGWSSWICGCGSAHRAGIASSECLLSFSTWVMRGWWDVLDWREPFSWENLWTPVSSKVLFGRSPCPFARNTISHLVVCKHIPCPSSRGANTWQCQGAAETPEAPQVGQMLAEHHLCLQEKVGVFTRA